MQKRYNSSANLVIFDEILYTRTELSRKTEFHDCGFQNACLSQMKALSLVCHFCLLVGKKVQILESEGVSQNFLIRSEMHDLIGHHASHLILTENNLVLLAGIYKLIFRNNHAITQFYCKIFILKKKKKSWQMFYSLFKNICSSNSAC